MENEVTLATMSGMTKNEGRPRTLGRVKRKEYLLFVLDVREAEFLARQRGLRIRQRSTWELRQEFEREHGEIYIKD